MVFLIAFLYIFAFGVEEVLSVPSDPGATYFVLKKAGTKQKPILTTKRTGSSGSSFAIREFDCKNKTARYLADSSTLEGLEGSKPEPSMSPVVEESVAWYQLRYSCKFK